MDGFDQNQGIVVIGATNMPVRGAALGLVAQARIHSRCCARRSAGDPR
jgi:hypothetical protein